MNASLILSAAGDSHGRPPGGELDLWRELGMLRECGAGVDALFSRRHTHAPAVDLALPSAAMEPAGSNTGRGHAARDEVVPCPVAASGTDHDQIAGFDPMTGLVNRRGFLVLLDVELPLAAGTGLPMAIVCLDVRHLRDINRRHGRAAGDAVLREIATRFARLANSSVFSARTGGDEFAALLLNVSDEDHLEQHAHRFIAECAGVIQYGADLIAFQVAAGASLVPPHSDPDAALLRAEIALDCARGARTGAK